MAAAALIDRAHFDHMTGGDVALQAEIVALFRAQAETWSGALHPHVSAWRDAAHTLKGSARGIGLWALAEACEAAEVAPDEAVALARVRAALSEALAALAATR